MRVREAGKHEQHQVMQVVREAFESNAEAQLVADLLDDPTAQPCLSLLAIDDARVIGHILFTTAHLNGATSEPRVMILAPLAVTPQFQRKGVGGALIEQGMRRLADDGVQLVFVLGHPGYYTRHGFVPCIAHGLLPPHLVVPGEAWMVRALVPDALDSIQGVVRCAASMNKLEYWRE